MIIGNQEADNFTEIKINEFKGKKYIDIRNMWNNAGTILPTKKGISIPFSEVDTLITFLQKIKTENI